MCLDCEQSEPSVVDVGYVPVTRELTIELFNFSFYVPV